MNAAAPRTSGSGGYVALAALPLLAVWMHQAWVSEDAHITLRTLEQLASGNGLRWNPDERVQTYSHPLWLFLTGALDWVVRDPPWTLTLLGLACSLAAFVALATSVSRRPAVLWIALAAPWALSPSLARYATSGFENPLSHLWIALQAATLLRLQPGDSVPWGRLTLVAALAGVTRLDTLVLHGPILLALAAVRPRAIPWRRIALGTAPLLAWLGFSLFYYGALVPNTALAKLAPGVPRTVYLGHGITYLADLVARDPVAAGILVAGWAAAIHAARRFFGAREDARSAGLAGLGAGSIAYTAAVVWTGGDFLSGRYLSAPVLASLALAAASSGTAWDALRRAAPRTRWGLILGFAAAAIGIYLGARAVVHSAGPNGIREISAAHLALGRDGRWHPTPQARDFARLGHETGQRARAEHADVAVLPVIGIAALAAGRELILVDPYALSDPLLARLRPAQPHRFVPGHLEREIPTGYLEARDTGDTRAMDPALASYYEKLRLVVAGPLFSSARLRALFELQLGVYDDQLVAYETRNRKPAE